MIVKTCCKIFSANNNAKNDWVKSCLTCTTLFKGTNITTVSDNQPFDLTTFVISPTHTIHIAHQANYENHFLPNTERMRFFFNTLFLTILYNLFVIDIVRISDKSGSQYEPQT